MINNINNPYKQFNIPKVSNALPSEQKINKTKLPKEPFILVGATLLGGVIGAILSKRAVNTESELYKQYIESATKKLADNFDSTPYVQLLKQNIQIAKNIINENTPRIEEARRLAQESVSGHFFEKFKNCEQNLAETVAMAERSLEKLTKDYNELYEKHVNAHVCEMRQDMGKALIKCKRNYILAFNAIGAALGAVAVVINKNFKKGENK